MADFQMGPNYEKAVHETLEALRMDPDDEDNYHDVAFLYLALDRLNEAEAVLNQAEARRREGEGLLADRYTLAFLRGDEEGMVRVAASLDKGKALFAFALRGFTEGYYGRLGKARELLLRALQHIRPRKTKTCYDPWSQNAKRTTRFSRHDLAPKNGTT